MSIWWLRSKERKTKSDEVKKNRQLQETTTKSYVVPVKLRRFLFLLHETIRCQKGQQQLVNGFYEEKRDQSGATASG